MEIIGIILLTLTIVSLVGAVYVAVAGAKLIRNEIRNWNK